MEFKLWFSHNIFLYRRWINKLIWFNQFDIYYEKLCVRCWYIHTLQWNFHRGILQSNRWRDDEAHVYVYMFDEHFVLSFVLNESFEALRTFALRIDWGLWGNRFLHDNCSDSTATLTIVHSLSLSVLWKCCKSHVTWNSLTLTLCIRDIQTVPAFTLPWCFQLSRRYRTKYSSREWFIYM